MKLSRSPDCALADECSACRTLLASKARWREEGRVVRHAEHFEGPEFNEVERARCSACRTFYSFAVGLRIDARKEAACTAGLFASVGVRKTEVPEAQQRNGFSKAKASQFAIDAIDVETLGIKGPANPDERTVVLFVLWIRDGREKRLISGHSADILWRTGAFPCNA